MINTTQISTVLSDITLPDATAVAGIKTTQAVQSIPGDQLEISPAARKLQALFDSSKDVKIRDVEELRQKIKYNGYPYKSDFYKYVEKLHPDI